MQTCPTKIILDSSKKSINKIQQIGPVVSTRDKEWMATVCCSHLPWNIVCLYIYPLKTGWWLSHPSEKYDFVSWDDELDIPNSNGK